MSFEPEIEEYTSKDTCTCESCGHINIIQIKNISSREKTGHMVYCDSATWLKIKQASASFKTIGNFLSFLIKFYESHKEQFNVPQI